MAHRNRAVAIRLKPSELLALLGFEEATFRTVVHDVQADAVLVYLEGQDWMPDRLEGMVILHATLEQARDIASPEYQAQIAALDAAPYADGGT